MFPFSAIVGQDDAKLALAIGAIDPGIGGILLSGVKGTGKSTLVRSFLGVLPEVEVFSGCRYGCLAGSRFLCASCAGITGDPVFVAAPPRLVTVPLGITEDRLLGTLNMEVLLKEGREVFLPGLLADANNQILYVDEVNLLPDNITDDILDSAACGLNTVEREGVSVTHPARFTLVGTMNPEEGQLRPQILDRFALSVSVDTVRDPALRAEIISRTLAFEADPVGFSDVFSKRDRALKTSINRARRTLGDVRVPVWVLHAVAGAMNELGVDGQRPDIVTIRAASAIAALEGKVVVDRESLAKAAKLAVCHRTRCGGFSQPPTREEVTSMLEKAERDLGKIDRSLLWDRSQYNADTL